MSLSTLPRRQHLRAFVYARASRDPKKRGRSTGDQMTENRSECAANGWHIAGEFIDDDRSASRHARRQREEFEAMIARIEAGECDILVTWEASRFHRDLEVYLRLRKVCMAASVLWCYNGTVYDLSKRSDRRATAMDAIQAEDEADGIRDRVLRTKRLQAEKGQPAGRILYGYARRYNPDTGDLIEQYPHPDRAPVVKEIYERVAGGETVYAIVRSLNERGIRTHYGHEWKEYHVSAMLRNSGYIARRIHQGKEVGPAQWAPIVDEETYYTVQRIVRAPERLTVRDRSIKHLLSGIAVCGECSDEPVIRVRKNRTQLTYQCIEQFHTSMEVNKFRAYVEEAVITWLSSDAALAAFRGDDEAVKAQRARVRYKNLVDQLDEARELASQVNDEGVPRLSAMSLASMESRLGPQIERAKAEAEVSSAIPPLLRGLVGRPRPDVERIWNDDLALTQQRMVLRLIVRIRLHKARSRGMRAIEPGRITLSFVGQPGFVKTGDRRPGSAPALAAADEPASGSDE